MTKYFLLILSLYDKRPTFLIQKQAIRTVRTERNVPATEILLKFVLCYFKYLDVTCLQHLPIWCNCGLPLKQESFFLSPSPSPLSSLASSPPDLVTVQTQSPADTSDRRFSLSSANLQKEKPFSSDWFTGLAPGTKEVHELAQKYNRNPLLPMGMAVVLDSIISSHMHRA